MISETSYNIASRFWAAFDLLKANHPRGFEYQFIKAVGSNIGNFRKFKADYTRRFDFSFLTHIVVVHGVNADWLVTGRGEMFKKKEVKKGSTSTSVC